MPFDIYGSLLKRGHCEVHPHVGEEYPCSVCLAGRDVNDSSMCHDESLYLHNAELILQITETEEERDKLKAVNADLLEALKHIAEYWNQDTNPQAMADACWHSIDTARAAIAKAEGL